MLYLKLIRKYVIEYKLNIILLFFLNFIIWVATFLNPYLTSIYIDSIINYKNNIAYILKYIIIIEIIKIASGYFSGIYNAKTISLTSFNINHMVIKHIQKLPLTFFNDTNIAYLNQRINFDSNKLASFFVNNYTLVITNICSIFLVTLILIKLDLNFVIFILIFICLYIISYLFFKSLIYKKGYKYREEENKFFSKMNEQFYNIKLIKMNSLFNTYENILQKSFQYKFFLMIDYAKCSYLYTNMTKIITAILSLITLSWGGYKVISGQLSLGNLTMILSYINIIISSIHYLLNLLKDYQDTLISVQRILEILNTKVESNGNKLLYEVNNIKIDNISFSYDDKIILDNFNYEFVKGKIYCIVGRNGSGKSTFINLIIGLIDNYIGNIYYNDINIKDLNLYNIRKKLISISEQEPQLVNDTILNNITLGIENTLHEDIIKLCKEINIYDFIINLPLDFNENVCENSTNLSGGEKQKISLVKVFLKNSPILILDEPTSALDRNSTNTFISMITRIKSDKIIIIITHDESILSISDEILYF